MDLRAPLQLQSMIKSMTDVVLPAIDAENQMAQEQAQLIVGMMHLMAARLPMQFHYDLDELQRYLDLSQKILVLAEGGESTSDEMAALQTLTEHGTKVVAGAQASPSDLELAVTNLRNQISSLVNALWQDGEQSSRSEVGRLIVEVSKAQIMRERSWFAPQGWDADPSLLPPIEELINYPVE